MATESNVRTITASAARDVALYLPHGAATVSVDRAATVASVTLRPAPGPEGRLPSPISAAVFRESEVKGGPILAVRVPPEVGGRQVRPIRAEIVLPQRAFLEFLGHTAALSSDGVIAGAQVRTVSGEVDLDQVGVLTACSISGSVRVGTVGQVATVRTGDLGVVMIRHYHGREADISTHGGPVSVHVEKDASGRLTVHSPYGEITVSGRTSVLGELVTEHTFAPAEAELVGISRG